MLGVNERTIRNWENGTSAIPYAAFRLMRMAAGYQLLGKEWEGWTLWRGLLWTPENRSFAPHELRYIANYLSMARHWIRERQAARAAAADAATSNPPCRLGFTIGKRKSRHAAPRFAGSPQRGGCPTFAGEFW
jgi:hypothetical protein